MASAEPGGLRGGGCTLSPLKNKKNVLKKPKTGEEKRGTDILLTYLFDFHVYIFKFMT